jgi:N4-gp56 family major capsid protein
MATFDAGVNHPLARKAWARKLYADVVGKGYYGRFLGKGDNSLFQLKEDLAKDKGDQITYGLRALPSGAGVQGDATQEGNEEALATYSDAIVINQLRHAFRSGGKMTEQRVPFSVREEMRSAAEDWWFERLETTMANQLAGYADQSDTRYTGNNAASEPSTVSGVTRILVGGGQTTEASLSATTTHAIKLSDLDKAAAIAKTQSPRIRPLRVDGKQLYVCFLHPYQILQLRQDASTAGNFYDVQKAQLTGGKISDNPIITGGEFIYNGTIVYEWPYLPVVKSTVSSSTSYRRGVFCGAQALGVAVGGAGSATQMDWNEELFDYGNQLGVEAGMIFGVKKTKFNSSDFATIVLSGYAPAP